MTQKSHPDRAFDRQQLRPSAPKGQRVWEREHVRLARGLLNVTPAQLSAQFNSDAPKMASPATAKPAYTPEHVEQALRAVIGWYQADLGIETMSTPGSAGNAAPGESLMPHYLAVRSRWENRAAMAIVARMSAQAGSEKTQPANTATARGVTRKRALLVDDVADVVVTVAAYLDALGFEVIRAPSGDAALHILAADSDIDLLVTDHAMPGMRGKDLVSQARELHPELRAMIITGYPNADELGSLPEGVTLLAKPFRRPQMAERIQQVFASRRASAEHENLQDAHGG